MNSERIAEELDRLRQGNQEALLVKDSNGNHHVLYTVVPVTGHVDGMPKATDVLVPVPDGYPGAMIDLAGLPVGSALLGRVKGQPNGPVIAIESRQFQIFSYHPHGNAGGGPWDQTKHGFHTYFDWILAWLGHLT